MAGVYATHSVWGAGVRSIYEVLTYAGAGSDYSNYLSGLDADLVKRVTSGIVLPDFVFYAAQNGRNSDGEYDDTWTVTAKRS